jgi:catechol 2,3-dioxygenase-like lactoylglutathione lyase family enzyme
VRNGIDGIDHPVIAVRDMEAAKQTYERLGFVVPPRGSHLEWGTGNWCIMFADDYLELRGIIDAERYTHGLEDFLKKREGLMGVAFGTIGADESHGMMRAGGLHPKPVVALGRNFELPEGWVEPRFRLCFPDEAEVPGLMSVVLCEHLTPELIRRPEFLAHPNGVRRVLSMTGVMAAPAEAISAHEAFLGPEAVAQDGRQVVLSPGRGQTIRLLPPEDFDALYGEVGFDPEPEPPYLAAVELEVADIARTGAVLDRNAVPYEQPKPSSLRVGPRETCGLILEFTAG